MSRIRWLLLLCTLLACARLASEVSAKYFGAPGLAAEPQQPKAASQSLSDEQPQAEAPQGQRTSSMAQTALVAPRASSRPQARRRQNKKHQQRKEHKKPQAIQKSAPRTPAPPTSLTAATAAPQAAPVPPTSLTAATAATDIAAMTGQPWFYEQVSDPQGFAAFRLAVEAQQARGLSRAPDHEHGVHGRWLIFWLAGDAFGLGNFVAGAAGALLLAAVTNRTFGILDPRMDFCGWTTSPLCSWSAALPNYVETLVRNFALPKKKRDPAWDGWSKQVKYIAVGRPGCPFVPDLKCNERFAGDVSSAKIVVVVSMGWFGDFLLTNPYYESVLRQAFTKKLASGREELDFFGPISRWIYAPNQEIQTEVDEYVNKQLRQPDGRISVCVLNRWGGPGEARKISKCLAELQKSSWWPRQGAAFHVATVQNKYRHSFKEHYEKEGNTVSWPDWPARGRLDALRHRGYDVKAYKEMLLLGRCHIAVLPNGGSTFSYMPTSMYHSVALRDVFYRANDSRLDCKDLEMKPYRTLYPDARPVVEGKCYAIPCHAG